MTNSAHAINNLKINYDRFQKEYLRKRFEKKHGVKAQPSKLGLAYPTTGTLKVRSSMPPEDFKQTNTNYWSRIYRGKWFTKDPGIINRIEQDLHGSKTMLDCILVQMLLRPNCNKKDLDDLLIRLSPKLEGILFELDEHHQPIQKRCYWTIGSIETTNSLEFATYQLALIRARQLNKKWFDVEVSITDLTLLILRLLINTPLRTIAESILAAYAHFLSINKPGTYINTQPSEQQSSILPSIFSLSFPDAKYIPEYFYSFDRYLKYHINLYKDAKKTLFMNEDAQVLGAKLQTEIHYWADKCSHYWLTPGNEKLNLATGENGAPATVLREVFGHPSLHRIW